MVAQVAITFFATSFVAFYVYRKFYKHRLFKRLGIPGPEPHWLFGNSVEIWTTKNRHLVYQKWTKAYGPFVGFYEGSTPVLLTSSLEAVNQICIKQFSNFQGRHTTPVEPDPKKKIDCLFTPPGIIFGQGESWKRLRTSLNPVFSTGKLKSYMPTMLKSQQDLLSHLMKHAQTSEAFNIHESFQLLTLELIAEICFGIEMRCFSDEGKSNVLLQSMRVFLEVLREIPVFAYPLLTFSEISSPFVTLIRIAGSTLQVGPMAAASKIRKIALDVVQNRVSHPEQRRADVLQSLIEASELNASTESQVDSKVLLTRGEVFSQAFDLFIAGTETTSTALGFACYLLAKHQDVQAKLYDEIEALIQAGKQADYGEIMAAPYLNCVCNETIRLFPVAITALNRFVQEDSYVCGVTMPKDAVVYCDVFSIHHDPELWGPVAPEIFHPERFSKQYLEEHPRPETAFLAFGFGPKICAGMRLALLEMKMTLVTLIQTFKILERDGGYPNGLPLKTDLFMSPVEGVFVKLQPR